MSRIVYARDLPRPLAPPLRTAVVELGFPCHVACRDCLRGDVGERPACYGLALRRLERERAQGGGLRALFYGGDPYADPKAFLELLVRVSAAGTAPFEAAALSDGVAWSWPLSRAFARAGLTTVQVTLEGGPAAHDAARPGRGGEPTFDRIVASLAYHRDALRAVVRLHAEPGDAAVDAVAARLERAGLFAAPDPVTLLVAPRASYHAQARDLAALLALPGGAPAVSASA
jgi:hypothetical protein